MEKDLHKTRVIYVQPEDRLLFWYNHLRIWATPSKYPKALRSYKPYDITLYGIIRNGEFIYDTGEETT